MDVLKVRIIKIPVEQFRSYLLLKSGGMKCKILFKITRETFALDVFAVLILATLVLWFGMNLFSSTKRHLSCFVELVATLPFRLGEF